MLLLLTSWMSRPFLPAFFRNVQLFLLVMPVCACGSQPPMSDGSSPKPETHFESELMPLVAAYENDAAANAIPVSPELRDQLVQVVWQDDLGQQGDETVLGRCERLNENHPDEAMRFRTVKIRKPDAAGYVGRIKVDALTLKTIVYHELGHCLHDFRGHLPEASHQIMSTALPKERFQSFHELLHQHFALLKSGH
jgi:hypothetical protein